MNPYAGNEDSYPATVPLPDDSDPPKAATFNPAPQGLADRTAALAAGYRTELADLDALAAIDTTSVLDTATRVVAGLGVYKLDKTDYPTFAEDLPAVVAPTTGTGRWFAQDIARINYEKPLTGSGTWTCPPNIALVSLEMIGPGGGGGGGAGGDTSVGGSPLMAGSGGGAAPKVVLLFVPDSGNDHSYACGAGGAGGAGGIAIAGPGSDGADGSESVIEWASDASKFAIALGGRGGAGGPGTSNGSARTFLLGGVGIAGTEAIPGLRSYDTGPGPRMLPGEGGFTVNFYAGANENVDGAPSVNSFEGGIKGTRGATHTHGGGGGGGGGGASEYGDGGAGGNGGDGAASGDGVNGSAGTAAASTAYGAGGGGGGAAGSGSTAVASTGGAGGAGGPGQIIIRAIR